MKLGLLSSLYHQTLGPTALSRCSLNYELSSVGLRKVDGNDSDIDVVNPTLIINHDKHCHFVKRLKPPLEPLCVLNRWFRGRVIHR